MKFTSDDLFYATPALDRGAHLRVSEHEMSQRIAQTAARFIIVHRTRNMFLRTATGLSPVHLNAKHIEVLLPDSPWVYLGEQENDPVFAIDVSHREEKSVLDLFAQDFEFEDLRRAGPLAEKDLASQMAYARALMYWHSRHQFCGVCGHPTRMKQAGHVRQCENPDCGVEHFPRTDPAVIMLVTDGDNCLLGRHSRLKEGMYSTLAGFVEPGETLEQAVRREVFEETGIQVGQVDYAGSQPWPFPTALMVGFYAQAQSRDITLDTNELEDAQWFSRNELKNFKAQGKCLPTTDSIARNLVDHWLATS